MATASELWAAYRLRWKRRGLLLRALRKRREIAQVADRTAAIRPGDILLFATLRNEATRLPHFLDHYRRLGVSHFLVVDNASIDGSAELLAAEPDVSLWRTAARYRASRFGLDWLTWLMLRHGSGHWCLTVDADELLIYPDWETRALPKLTGWLDAQGVPAMAALMLEPYPKGQVSAAAWQPGTDPMQVLQWFDAYGYDWTWQQRYGNISIRGGPRRRLFFAENPEHAPHLHKTPLVRWRRPYAYLSSTHILLPRRLNRGFDARLNRPTGVLLHTKFLPQVVEKAREEKARRQHFTHAGRYDAYYDAIIADPDLWYPGSERYEGWRQLEALGLMTRGDWA
jgi:glycosyltransferase involved in cell wall biosynthesis